MNVTDMIQAIQKRSNPPRFGVRTAADYLRGIGSCMADGFCAQTIGELATSEQWAKALEEGAQRLVYNDEDTIAAFNKTLLETILEFFGVKAHEIKRSEGSILDFAAVLTTTRKDRDGDVLETKGAQVDAKMALLWQHIPFSPIGKMVRVLQRNDSKLLCQFAIADTVLGRDAAALVEMDALRMSHGFRPEEWEPLEEAEKGWRFLKFEIIEASLVSIPSNKDAVIQAFSREKLHHPLVKAWAQKQFDARPAQVTSGFVTRKDGTQAVGFVAKDATACACDKPLVVDALVEEVKTFLSATPREMDFSKGSGSKCASKKDYVPLAEVAKRLQEAKAKAHVQLEGSWESIWMTLAKSLKPYLIGKGSLSEYGYCYIEAMFDGSAIICIEKSSAMSYFRLGWSMSENKPGWVGDPVEVKITAQIEEVGKAYIAQRAASRTLVRLLNGELNEAELQLLEDAMPLLSRKLEDWRKQQNEADLARLLNEAAVGQAQLVEVAESLV